MPNLKQGLPGVDELLDELVVERGGGENQR